MRETGAFPVAIVGMACRFPGGASSPRAYWELLCRAEDAIVDVPRARWDARRFHDPDPERPGKIAPSQAGFLREPVDHFDPGFFGIAARDAAVMDPQQRLLLMVAWETIEDAGIPLDALQRMTTGVFMGGFTLDNMVVKSLPWNMPIIGPHSGTSSSLAMLANRVSHALDLLGPSLALDTACSSSLVAVQVACRSLESGDCDAALVGGVNVILQPAASMMMSRGRFLSPESRCMAFDERASGYVRGEGAGVILVKSLDRALEDGDRVHAVIRSVQVNQDGATIGISSPNSAAQEELLRRTYAAAGVRPSEIGFVEAHGTGTQAGDPAEARALDAVLREGRDTGHCLVGSSKSVIGHLEAAAGVAGLMKAALCLQQGKVPPNLHFETPSRAIPFDRYCLRVATRLEELPASSDGSRYAAVNSFGYGGTNAHALLQSAPRLTVPSPVPRWPEGRPFLFPLSARSPGALRDLCGAFATYLEGSSESLQDVLHSAILRRTHHRNRAAVSACNRQELIQKLREATTADTLPGLVSDQLPPGGREPRLAFVYSGMGPQWWGMGRELWMTEPTYRAAVEEVDAIFAPLAGWSLVRELQQDEPDSRMARTAVAQPASFALQVGLTRWLAEIGLKPAAVVGHSVGEVAAAWASGALSLEDAVRVSFHRSRLQQTLARPDAAMLAVGLSRGEAEVLLDEVGGELEIAAQNAPSSVTLAGSRPDLEKVAALLQDEGIFNRFLHVEVAYHSQAMDAIRGDILDHLRPISPRVTEVTFLSTVTGTPLTGPELDAEYWWKNVRQPVELEKTVSALIARGDVDALIEVGPHPVLVPSLRETVAASGARTRVLSTLRRAKPERATLLETAGGAWALGSSLRWEAAAPVVGKLVDLPSYPWQLAPYWEESRRSLSFRTGPAEPTPALLNEKVDDPGAAWEVEVNPGYFPYLLDHRIGDATVFPGAAYLQAAVLAAGGTPMVATDLRFERLLVHDPSRVTRLRVALRSDDGTFTVHGQSQLESNEVDWIRHARGRVFADRESEGGATIDVPALRAGLSRSLQPGELYDELRARGMDYGPAFRTVESLWAGHDELIAELSARGPRDGTDPGLETFDPTVVDGAMQAFLALAGSGPGSAPLVPVSIERLRAHGPLPARCVAHVRVSRRTRRWIEGAIRFATIDGEVVLALDGVRFQALEDARSRKDEERPRFHVSVWEKSPLAGDEAPLVLSGTRWLLVEAGDGPHTMEDALRAAGAPLRSVPLPATPEERARFRTRVRDASDGFAPTHVLLRWISPEVPSDLDPRSGAAPISPADPLDATMVLVDLLAAMDPGSRVDPLRFALVTREAQAVLPDEAGSPAGNSLWGLARVAMAEYQALDLRLVDVGAGVPDEHVILEIAGTGPETEVALRGSDRFRHRLQRRDHNAPRSWRTLSTRDACIRLETTRPGDLDGLELTARPMSAPRGREVVIETHLAPLNFKDLLKILNRLPAEATEAAFFGESLGMEVTGTIAAVGPEATGWKIGDRVVAHVPTGCFASYLTTDTPYIARVPDDVRFEDLEVVATLTVHHAFRDVARLQPGEKVLIHNGTGGVGLAAIRLARHIGAEVFTTAGTPEKRQHLRDMGLEHVFDSRSLAFADHIRAATGGRGVDVVLSALSGAAQAESFKLVAPFGRFVEIGKQDILADAGLPMRTFNRNVSFSAIDIDRLLAERVSESLRLLHEVVELHGKKIYGGIPARVFPVSEAAEAFRFMAQSRHIGKVSLSFFDQAVPCRQEAPIRNDATYLVTGGTSGFGRTVAAWLAGRGAGALALLSRRGADAETTRLIEKLRQDGVQVETFACDTSQAASLESALARIRESMPPLRGVFHGAMVLEDGFLASLQRDALERVLAPKARGAIELDRLTRRDPLDHFVCFSSVSAVIGNPGQAAYVAANSFLDGMVSWRRARGLPATTIQWGVLGESGVVARSAELTSHLEATGLRSLSDREALEALHESLAAKHGVVGCFEVDWSRWKLRFPRVAATPRFEGLIGSPVEDQARRRLSQVRHLLPLSPESRLEAVAGDLQRQVSRILRTSLDQVDPDTSLAHAGVDSLIAAELGLALERELDFTVTATELMGGPSVRDLARRFLERLPRALAADAEGLLLQVDDLSEDETKGLLELLENGSEDAT